MNDADAYLSNFWRALAADPEAVAAACDFPVSEIDLFARHIWLVNEGKARIARMESDPDFYDVKVAGWWVWGLNAWIGSGWCAGNGPWGIVDGTVQLPHLGDAGRGVNRKLPHLGDAGRGVNRKLPHLGDAGQGVNRTGDGAEAMAGGLHWYLAGLSARLRQVRVCCGDWSRVLTDGATSFGKTVGVFLDPPYLGDVRTKDLYRVDDHEISHAVRRWAIEKGDDSRFRIVLAGYRAEHEAEMPATWRRKFYSAGKAYGSTAAVGGKAGNDSNRHNEALWFSPGCLDSQPGLFAEAGERHP